MDDQKKGPRDAMAGCFTYTIYFWWCSLLDSSHFFLFPHTFHEARHVKGSSVKRLSQYANDGCQREKDKSRDQRSRYCGFCIDVQSFFKNLLIARQLRIIYSHIQFVWYMFPWSAETMAKKRRVSKGVDVVFSGARPGQKFQRSYAVQPLRDTAARSIFLYALWRV